MKRPTSAVNLPTAHQVSKKYTDAQIDNLHEKAIESVQQVNSRQWENVAYRPMFDGDHVEDLQEHHEQPESPNSVTAALGNSLD